MENQIMEERISELQHEVRSLNSKLRFQGLTLLFIPCLLFLFAFTTMRNEYFDQLTTKTLIVQDAKGNDRIIISPEISETKSRIRKDTLEGIVILDEHGYDRVVLGATPTALVNNRLVRRAENDFPYGYAFNDKKGNERGGFGYYADRGMVSFGMDHSNGQEALVMFVADKEFYGQKAGIVINDPKGGQQLYAGSNVLGETMLNLDVPSKTRLSMHVDSTGISTVSHYDYKLRSDKVFISSQQ